MSYYPFLRGKQYELICLRENAQRVAAWDFCPIIEPVKEGATSVLRAIDALKSAEARFLVIGNPCVGHHAAALSQEFVDSVDAALVDYGRGNWLHQLSDEGAVAGLAEWLQRKPASAVLHQTLASPRSVVELLELHGGSDRTHIFGHNCSTRYRAAFQSREKVLLLDGFKKRKNAEYPEVELFSELPVTFREQGFHGHGDYLIVGSDYSEGGGAAYAVAIHITYADEEDDGVIYVRHFVSDTNSTPTDPAGKFHEAVGKLVSFCLVPGSKVPRTKAVEEFAKLYQSGHYPGLGYVKKLSMQHHLEVMGG